MQHLLRKHRRGELDGDGDREHKSNGNERAHYNGFFLVPKMTGEGNGTDSTVSTDMMS